MGLLSDHGIKKGMEDGDLSITPFNPDNLNPSSYDLTLHPLVKVAHRSSATIDTRDVAAGGTYTYQTSISDDHGFVIQPGMCVLGSTVERITISSDLAGRMEGKSSLARLFLVVHSTAGFFDPGWDGEGTLEIINHSPRPIRLWPGMRIAQMAFFRMAGRPERGYGQQGHYQGQVGPTESRYRIPERCASGVDRG